MKTKPNFNASFRITLGNQHIGWLRTDAKVVPSKAMHAVVEDYSDQVAELLAGTINEVDETAASSNFFVNRKPDAKKPDVNTFLGYLTTKHPAHAEVLVRLWPTLAFTNHAA